MSKSTSSNNVSANDTVCRFWFWCRSYVYIKECTVDGSGWNSLKQMNSGKSPSVDPHVQNILSRVTKTWPPRGTSKPRIRVFAPLRVKTKGKSAQPWWLFLAGPLLAPRTTAVNSRLLHRCLFFTWVWLRRPCKRDLCHVSAMRHVDIIMGVLKGSSCSLII